MTRAAALRVQRALERRATVPQHRRPVRHEHPRDRELEERSQRECEAGDARPLGQPALRTESNAAAVLCAEDDVARDDRAMRRQPVHDLVRAGGAERLDPAGERIARPERLDGRRPPPHRSLPAGRCEDACPMAAYDDVSAPRMPEHRHEHHDGLADPLHESVEGVVPIEQRIDQHETVVGLVGDRADVLAPLRVESRPAPESWPNLGDAHLSATLAFDARTPRHTTRDTEMRVAVGARLCRPGGQPRMRDAGARRRGLAGRPWVPPR